MKGSSATARMTALGLVLAPALLLQTAAGAATEVPEPAGAGEETRVTMRATGPFEVTLKPLETYNQDADAKVGRMSIDKTYEGDLVATGRGEMLTGGSPAEGSAGYVAIERVTGSLGGRSGSFLLQHSGTMTPEAQQLTITVVPASGTGELEGLSGTMAIEIEDGEHSYVFDYTLPETP